MNLQLTILEALRDIGARLMPEPTLLNQVRLSQPHAVTAAQLAAELKALESKNQVVGDPNEDTGTKWKITSEGKLRLAEAGL